MTTITAVQARDKLRAQNEPHWVKLSTGCYLGFRKLTPTSTGTWLARYRDDAGKQHKRSLGEFGEVAPSQRYDAAKRTAEEWFVHLGRGGSAQPSTVRRSCEKYVNHVRGMRGNDPADDIEMRFNRWVFGDSGLADLDLAKLSKTRLERWRATMTKTPVTVNRDKRKESITRPRAASSINRDIASLRAALNFAHDAGDVTSDMAWRVALRPTKNVDGRRDLYLDLNQRRALIEKSQPDLGALLRGLSLVPLRPGALASLKVSSLDARLSVLTIGQDKAGRDRRIKLPVSTADFFVAQATGKKPDEPLLSRLDGKAWNKDAWKGPVKAAANAAELPTATTAYTIRHSVITDLVTNGLDLLTVAQLSGTSVAMIERHYGHFRADHAAAALAKLTL
jgi:integrase